MERGALGTFVVKRVLSALLVLWGVVTITFILLKLTPGDFFTGMVP